MACHRGRGSTGDSRGGRGSPPTNLIINPEACFSIGLNVDRDHITIVLVNFVGETIARRSQEAAFALPDDVAAFFRDSVSEMIAEADVDLSHIVGVGVASPDDMGQVDLPGRPDGYGQWDSIDWKALSISLASLAATICAWSPRRRLADSASFTI